MATTAQIQAQPWYPAVASAMAKAGVSPAIWISTLNVEDGQTLSPTQVTNDPDQQGNPGYSYGLFQLRQPGLGSGYSTAQLEDGPTNATIAAATMGPAIAGLGAGASYSAQLKAVEEAGWPGNLSEDSARQAALQSYLTANGFTYSQSASPQDGSTTPPQVAQSPYTANTSGSPSWLTSLLNWGTNFENAAEFYTVALGFILIGGLLLVAAAVSTPQGQTVLKTAAKVAA
jgi:hypothetical protein